MQDEQQCETQNLKMIEALFMPHVLKVETF